MYKYTCIYMPHINIFATSGGTTIFHVPNDLHHGTLLQRHMGRSTAVVYPGSAIQGGVPTKMWVCPEMVDFYRGFKGFYSVL